MKEFELLVDFHKKAARQGPGSEQDTTLALRLLNLCAKKDLTIADIGCGTGAQTFILAQNTKAKITAVDLFLEFLTELEERAQKLGLQSQITTLALAMEELNFEPESFDVIWSEGAIYNMGFEAGVKNWKKFLKPGGYISVSEITWLTDHRPKELDSYWKNEYPEIDTASAKIGVLEQNGFMPVGYFVLPQESWLDNYYRPMEERFEAFLHRHQHSIEAKTLVEREKQEIQLYLKYKAYYSYGFYVARKMQ